MKIGMIFSVAAAIIGDFSGKYLAEYQPEKLAAAEWHFETEGNAPFDPPMGVLGWGRSEIRPQGPVLALSILAHSIPSAEVIGLDQFPDDEIPPLYIHYLFDIMVTIKVWMTVLSACILDWNETTVGRWFRRSWFRWLIVLGGPLSICSHRGGLVDGRSRKATVDFKRAHAHPEEAATTSGHVDTMLILFCLLYIVLGIGVIVVLRRMFRNNPVEREIEDREMEKGGDVL